MDDDDALNLSGPQAVAFAALRERAEKAERAATEADYNLGACRTLLAAAQAREHKLREALVRIGRDFVTELTNEADENYIECDKCCGVAHGVKSSLWVGEIDHFDSCPFAALSAPQDDSALRAMMVEAVEDGIFEGQCRYGAAAYGPPRDDVPAEAIVDRVLGGAR